MAQNNLDSNMLNNLLSNIDPSMVNNVLNNIDPNKLSSTLNQLQDQFGPGKNNNQENTTGNIPSNNGVDIYSILYNFQNQNKSPNSKKIKQASPDMSSLLSMFLNNSGGVPSQEFNNASYQYNDQNPQYSNQQYNNQGYSQYNQYPQQGYPQQGHPQQGHPQQGHFYQNQMPPPNLNMRQRRRGGNSLMQGIPNMLSMLSGGKSPIGNMGNMGNMMNLLGSMGNMGGSNPLMQMLMKTMGK